MMKPSSTTGFLPNRLLLFNMPKTPPPGQRDQRTDMTKAEAAFQLCRTCIICCVDRYAQEMQRQQVAVWTALSSQTRRTSRHFCVLLFSQSFCVVVGVVISASGRPSGAFPVIFYHLFACDSPRISPTPIQMPEMPIRLFASWPNCVMAPMHVPYTPL